VAIDPLNRGESLEQLVEVVGCGLRDFAHHLDLPGSSLEAAGVGLGVALVGAELVVVVVAGDVFVRGELVLVIVKQSAGVARHETDARHADAGGLEEFAPIPEQRLVGDVGAGDIGGTADEHEDSKGGTKNVSGKRTA
jgi:hypothetical protein